MPFADVEGVRLYWDSSGSGEPLLLIQGLGFSADMWFRIVPTLEDRFRVIRYDARGIGRSDVPPGPYTIEVAAADAAAVLDAAEEGTAHVLGVSLGGIVAQEFALTFPERVRSLMLGCTHPGGEGTVWPDPEVMQTLANRTEAATPAESIRATERFAYAPATPPEVIDEDVRRRLELLNTDEGYRNQLAGGLGYQGTLDRLGSISAPTLVFTGAEDRMVPPVNSDLLAREIPDARLVIVPGAGHVVFTDKPEAVCEAIIGFVDSLEKDKVVR
jgi:pimeloyl-ACP methyl ester carboxylesterase